MLNQKGQSKTQALHVVAVLGSQAQALNCNAHAESCNTLCGVGQLSKSLLWLNIC